MQLWLVRPSRTKLDISVCARSCFPFRDISLLLLLYDFNCHERWGWRFLVERLSGGFLGEFETFIWFFTRQMNFKSSNYDDRLTKLLPVYRAEIGRYCSENRLRNHRSFCSRGTHSSGFKSLTLSHYTRQCRLQLQQLSVHRRRRQNSILGWLLGVCWTNTSCCINYCCFFWNSFSVCWRQTSRLSSLSKQTNLGAEVKIRRCSLVYRKQFSRKKQISGCRVCAAISSSPVATVSANIIATASRVVERKWWTAVRRLWRHVRKFFLCSRPQSLKLIAANATVLSLVTDTNKLRENKLSSQTSRRSSLDEYAREL